ncbi:hypothetical protein [Aureimonas leprariae]|nr:hypothetical protein [Aureimonas leprariae]
MLTRPRILGGLAFVCLLLLSAAAVGGWASRGETIFLRMAEAAWANCL